MSMKYYLGFNQLVEQISREGWTDEFLVISLDWELPDVINSSLSSENEDLPKGRWNPATHVVLLTEGSNNGNATATTCTEYINKTWPTRSKVVLDQLDEFTTVILSSSKDQGKFYNSIKCHSDLGLNSEKL
jgi:hypothetical protein